MLLKVTNILGQPVWFDPTDFSRVSYPGPMDERSARAVVHWKSGGFLQVLETPAEVKNLIDPPKH